MVADPNETASVLHKIFARRKLALAELNSDPSRLARLKDESLWPQQSPFRFRQAFSAAPSGTYKVIAEIKRGSPSQGLFPTAHQPVAVAEAYAQQGATALSVLTEPEFFGGDTRYVEEIRKALPELPILMKDFFFSEAQVYEARAIGADAILLIAAYLPKERINALHDLAASLGLSTLLELHNASELSKAPSSHLESMLLGINTRDLTDLSIDLGRFAPVAKTVRTMAPLNALPLIAESGIKAAVDLRTLTEQGADGFLVGSSLMATADPGAALAELLGKEPS